MIARAFAMIGLTPAISVRHPARVLAKLHGKPLLRFVTDAQLGGQTNNVKEVFTMKSLIDRVREEREKASATPTPVRNRGTRRTF